MCCCGGPDAADTMTAKMDGSHGWWPQPGRAVTISLLWVTHGNSQGASICHVCLPGRDAALQHLVFNITQEELVAVSSGGRVDVDADHKQLA